MKMIEVTPNLSHEVLLQQLKVEDVVLTRGGIPVAVLSGIDDEELFWQAMENDPDFIASLVRAREEIAQGKGIPLEDVIKELRDDARYWHKREDDPEFIASIASAHDRVAKGQTISHEEVKKELGIK